MEIISELKLGTEMVEGSMDLVLNLLEKRGDKKSKKLNETDL